MKKLNKNLKRLTVLLIVFITAISCKSIVYIEPVPESLPGAIEKIQLEEFDFSLLTDLQVKKILINKYAVFIHDTRWRINHFTGLLINGNLSPEQFSEAVRPLYGDLGAYTKAFEEFKKSIPEEH